MCNAEKFGAVSGSSRTVANPPSTLLRSRSHSLRTASSARTFACELDLVPTSVHFGTFLTETDSHSKTAVTHSKQTTGAFLTETRIAHMQTVTPPRPYARLGANSMPPRGKFIVLEGIDGSGKRTQLEMLVRAFASHSVACSQISFPRYDGFFGKMAGQYLNGDFGSLEAVDAHFSAL